MLVLKVVLVVVWMVAADFEVPITEKSRQSFTTLRMAEFAPSFANLGTIQIGIFLLPFLYLHTKVLFDHFVILAMVKKILQSHLVHFCILS